MDINEQERIDAVNRYIKGDKTADIYRDANRSKKSLECTPNNGHLVKQ